MILRPVGSSDLSVDQGRCSQSLGQAYFVSLYGTESCAMQYKYCGAIHLADFLGRFGIQGSARRSRMGEIQSHTLAGPD
jgi:hypothetical protein